MPRIPRETYGVAALAAAGLSGYFLFTYAGPYRVVANAQVSLFHTNIVNISFLVTLALIALPLCGVVYALERKFGTRETWFTPIWHDLDRVLDLPPGKLLMIGATVLVMGGYFWVKDLGRGPLTSLSVAELEDGHALRGTYAELADGTTLENASIIFRSNSATYHYIPVVDHAQRPVLFLRVSERGSLRDAEGRIRGIVEENGLEGELQGPMRYANTLADRHFVLAVGRRPEPELGMWMSAAGFAALVAGLFWWRLRFVSVVG